ncbi:8674_t:CDS:2, partial [Gigaspora margarita]
AQIVAYFTKSLTAKHVQFLAVSVEYPPTDPEGYAIVYNFVESNNYSIANDDQTQKAIKDKAQTVFRPNGEQIQIMKDQRTCGGIKICPFANDDFHNYTHTNVDFDSNIFQSIKNNEELRSIQTNTLACTQWKYGVSGHRYLQVEENIDRQLLKQLINRMPLNQCNTNTTCNTVLSNNSKRLICSFPHINSDGKPFEAKLTHLQYNCWQAYTPPPPPNHIPEAIKD